MLQRKPCKYSIPRAIAAGPRMGARQENSVGAYWPPLTAEHAFPSLYYRAQGAPPLPARPCRQVPSPSPFPQRIAMQPVLGNKKRDTRKPLPARYPKSTPLKSQATSYGGIIRIR